MITFKVLRLTCVVYVFHTVSVFVTDIILNITSQEYLIFTFLHIGSTRNAFNSLYKTFKGMISNKNVLLWVSRNSFLKQTYEIERMKSSF